MSARSRSRSSILLTAPVVALALLMSGCGSDVDSAPNVPAAPAQTASAAASSMTEPTAETTASSDTETSDTESSDTESTTETSDTETSDTGTSDTETSDTGSSSVESTTEKSSSAPTKAQAITKPGTVLKLGAPAVVEYQTGKKGETYYQHGTMSTAITKIVKADPKVFDKLDNKAEFKDLVPYYVFSEATILSYEGKVDGNPPTQIVIYGVLRDGTEAGKAIGLTSLDGCEDSYFDEPKVGATASKCTVTLAKKGGAPVVGAIYQGDTDLYDDSSDNPFTKKPIIWAP